MPSLVHRPSAGDPPLPSPSEPPAGEPPTREPPAGDPPPRPTEPPAGDPPDPRPPVEAPRDEPQREATTLRAALAVLLLLALVPAPTSAAFTPRTQERIAAEAARLAPPDLARQIERREEAFQAGVSQPFRDASAAHRNAGPEGILDRVIVDEAQRAVDFIREHRNFDDVVRQLGVVSHYVAAANNPLNTAASDPREADYWADYARYVETAEPRLPLIFYGLTPGLDGRPDVEPLIAGTLARGRRLYPLIGAEYRRIGFASGLGRFDDRSTAFGVASLAFSHAVTDVVRVMRWIWLQAGGRDSRKALAERGTALLLLPRLPAAESPRP